MVALEAETGGSAAAVAAPAAALSNRAEEAVGTAATTIAAGAAGENAAAEAILVLEAAIATRCIECVCNECDERLAAVIPDTALPSRFSKALNSRIGVAATERTTPNACLSCGAVRGTTEGSGA